MALTQAEMAQVMRAIEENSVRLEDTLQPITEEEVDQWDIWPETETDGETGQ